MNAGSEMGEQIRSWAPGRVNLIGEHTDYAGGLVLPMAIQLGTTIEGERTDGSIRLRSTTQADEVRFDLPVDDPASITPAWGRYVGGVAAGLQSVAGLGVGGLDGEVSSDLPAGAGLSSSAALEVATAFALGAGDSLDRAAIAELCQRAEQVATGVPCGVMDQMASACGVEGHALRLDCSTGEIRPVPVPDDVAIVVVHSGQTRELAGSEYGDRRSDVEAATAIVGPLRTVTSLDALDAIDDPTVRRRARHVVTENARVDAFADAIAAGDLVLAGTILVAGHRSLRDDFDVSTDVLDALVDSLVATDGVYGARLTGAGFGGCVVALCRPGVDPTPPGHRSWLVRPSAGAALS